MPISDPKAAVAPATPIVLLIALRDIQPGEELILMADEIPNEEDKGEQYIILKLLFTLNKVIGICI